jgi:lysozyme family protein
MIGDFDKSFAIVVYEEGGTDPARAYQSPEQAIARGDSGGETKFGISKKAYPNLDIKNLTLDQAKEIYNSEYWVKIKGGQLPWPLCLFVFDSAINQGVDAAIKMLQKTVGVAQDGVLGRDTVEVASKANPFKSAQFMAIRGLRYTGTRGFDVAGKDWFTRLFDIAMKSST